MNHGPNADPAGQAADGIYQEVYKDEEKKQVT